MKKFIAALVVLMTLVSTANASFVVSDVTNESETIRTVKEVHVYFMNGEQAVFIEKTKTYLSGSDEPVGVASRQKVFIEDELATCLSACNYDAVAIETFAKTINFDEVSE